MKKYLLVAFLSLAATIGLCFARRTSLPSKDDASFHVDVDLTRLSSTMVYAEVFNMLIDPEAYEGKTVRMRGSFYAYEYDGSREGMQTFVCIIQDAAACCAQGLGFTLSGMHRYPQDYPEQYSDITVRGTYHQYEKDGLTYIELVDSVLEAYQPRA